LLLEEREKYNWPPFSRCAFVIIKSKNYKIASSYFQLPEFETIRRQAKQNEIEFYGPLHSGKQNFVHEWRFLVKVSRKKRIDLAMRSIISLLPKMPQIKVEFEIDPYIFT
jgi:primosomal protein N'